MDSRPPTTETQIETAAGPILSILFEAYRLSDRSGIAMLHKNDSKYLNGLWSIFS